jgi:hypothetical protein
MSADMRRGADEANAESHRAAQAQKLGAAVGGLMAVVAAINRIEERLTTIERKLTAAPAAATGDATKGDTL